MSDDTPARPRKTIDDTQFRQELFGEANVDAGSQPDIPALDEHGERAAPDARPAPSARPATGYRNPPVETRFAKGQSGNPWGRPRGSGKVKAAGKASSASPPSSPTLDEIRRRFVETPIKVREGEGIHLLHRIERSGRMVKSSLSPAASRRPATWPNGARRPCLPLKPSIRTI